MTSRTAKQTACKSCGKPIVWALGPERPGGGPARWMPIDAEPVPGGNLATYVEVHTGRLRWKDEIPSAVRLGFRAHWRSCPHVDTHRTPKKPASGERRERPAREQLDIFAATDRRRYER